MVESMGFGSTAHNGRRWTARGTADSSGCDRESSGCRAGAAPPLALDDRAGAAGRLDALARAGAERVRVHGQRLGEIALGEHLHRDVLAGAEALGLHHLESHLGARVEAALERGDVDRLGVGAEGLEGHRLLHVRPAQLSHAHVDRHLPTLETGPALGARPRAGTLLAAAGGLTRAGPFPAPYALAGTPASGSGREAVQPDALLPRVPGGAHLPSS